MWADASAPAPVAHTIPALTHAALSNSRLELDNVSDNASDIAIARSSHAPAPPLQPTLSPPSPVALPPIVPPPVVPPPVVPPPVVSLPIIPNVLPSAHYTIVTAVPGGPVLLNPQHLHVCAIIRATIPHLKLFLVIEHAFPDHFTASQFIRTTLIESAQAHGYLGLAERLTQDQDFVNPLVLLVSFQLPLVCV